MRYKVIEKNEYGVKVKNTTDISVCEICKYRYFPLEHNICKKCYRDSYYLPDSEAEKLESGKPTINGTTPDVVNLNSDTPKEYLFVESNTSLLIDPNIVNTSVFQFHQNGNVILEFKANGDIFIKGELVENNIDVVNLLKDICNGKYIQQTDSDTQKEHIDLRVELRVEKEKSKALEEYSRGLELKYSELIKYLEDNVECCKINEIDSNDPVDTATYSMYITYKNVLEFIKNQK